MTVHAGERRHKMSNQAWVSPRPLHCAGPGATRESVLNPSWTKEGRNEQLRHHLDAFVAAYNFGRRLKTLKGLTPHEFICKGGTSEPSRFTINPLQQMSRLNT